MRYTVVQFENGFYGVKDNSIKGFQTVAAGMTEAKAIKWAERLNLREAWGI